MMFGSLHTHCRQCSSDVVHESSNKLGGCCKEYVIVVQCDNDTVHLLVADLLPERGKSTIDGICDT